jgi:sialate O-acetylesterase
LVNTSWGGTNIETWISREAFQSSDEFKSMIAAMPVAGTDSLAKIGSAKLKKDMQKWREELLPQDLLSTWNQLGFDDSRWPKLRVPDMWETQGLYSVDGVLLFRKSFNVTADNAGKPAVLELAKIDDNDVTYVNGVKVGATDGYEAIRKYSVPTGVLKAGNNVIAVRITDVRGGGGIYSEFPLRITVGSQVESLAGEWAYKIESVNEAVYVSRVKENQYPTLVYNTMVNPLLSYAIKGVLWYQGESNAGRGWQYRKAFPLMINDWRRRWNQGDFPFYFAQLTSFDGGGSTDRRSGHNWAELREAQALTLSLPNTEMAVTWDVGESKSIHPRNKQDVGLRLALVALKDTYKQNFLSSGPVFQSMKAEGNKMILTFSNIGGGLITRDRYGYLRGFEVAGADQKYYHAKAYIQGDKVVVSSENVATPVAVRFGWFDDISESNLFNKEGLPAVPFRTDSWERETVAKKFELY